MIALIRYRLFLLIASMLFLCSLATAEPQKNDPPKKDIPKPETVKPEDADQLLVDLVTGPNGLTEKAFTKGEYKLVRSVFTRYFEAKNGEKLKEDLGDDAAPLFEWLSMNPEAKETLFTAIDPITDDAAKVMDVYRGLWKSDPAAVKANNELAVAVAVVWDNPKAVYDYRGHQVRTKSILPPEVMKIGAMDNFKYVLDRQSKLKGPQLQLPWEFLIHTVNHRTPMDERDWAIGKYIQRRPMIGTIYKEIEYDKVMLQTQSKVCKLNDKPYTLPSIRENGGVCAMQADFTARVAKSLMVPAEFVGGEGNSGVLHAWIMWVEVKSVNKDVVTFSLESFGRYNIDQYYVGTLRDPKTGVEITDRELERRLTAVGNSPHNSRQADLLMRAFPIVRDAKTLTTKQQLTYLNRVLALYPMCDTAWLELAALHRDGKLKDAEESSKLVDRAMNVFAKFPDFSWKLMEDLLTPQKDKLVKTKTYIKLVSSYELLGRPDLACEARLKLVDYQVEVKDLKKAFDGISFTVRKFPAEGRYIPKLMTRMHELAKDIKGGSEMLCNFYVDLVPFVPPTRGNEVSKYCVEMHKQAIAYLKENNRAKDATLLEQNLARITNGKAQ
ncbi:MAG TPA: hypothetical protein VG097_05215 [Gemmata sp.]|nr:hypothetical protein [Gemmata sp.]